MTNRITLIALVAFAASTCAAEPDAKTIYSNARPAVVLITTSDVAGLDIALGTGFAVADGAKIITNLHVIRGATSVKFKTSDSREYNVAFVTAYDALHDLVVLESPVAIPRLPTRLDRPSVGDTIYTIGNPKGLEATFSQGLVSAVRESEGSTLYQISAPISPGSSGGPVLDTAGRVIGVTTFMMRDGQNLNFSIPTLYIEPLLAKVSEIPIATFSHSSRPANAPLKTEIDRLWQQGLRDLALKKAEDYLTQNPNDPAVTSYVAKLLFFSGNWDGAINLYERTIELDPTCSYQMVNWFLIAKAHNHKKRYFDALRAFKHVGAPADLSANALWEVYITQLAAEKFDDARSTADILKHKPDADADMQKLLRDLPGHNDSDLADFGRKVLYEWTKRDSQTGDTPIRN